MKSEPKIRRLVTHAGPFHADDVFAAAVLRRLAPRAKVERTRDAGRLAQGRDDISAVVFDVGDAFEPERRNFDHHQRSFDRRRDNGIPYAAFGLIWERYGTAYLHALLGRAAFEDFDVVEVAAMVERKLVWAIDAADCGELASEAWLRGGDREEDAVSLTSVSAAISLLNPVGGHGQRLDFDGAFGRAIAIASHILEGSARRALNHFEAARAFAAADTGQPIVILGGYLSWHPHVEEHHRFVVYPSSGGDIWLVEAVQDDYVPRCPLPQDWAGLRDEELEEASGVAGAVFCHFGCFIGGATSREPAVEMARIALEACGESP